MAMLFKKESEEAKQAKIEAAHEADRVAKLKAFARTPQGQARAAWMEGVRLLEIALPVSQTTGFTVSAHVLNFLGNKGQYSRTRTSTNHTTLDLIEQEGWRLEHAGYTYIVERSETSRKVLVSGERESISGTLMGIYVFRRVDSETEEVRMG